MLRGRRITVGIAGGIAAYKGAELVRLLVKEGAEVQVVMTRNAERFITRLSLQALSGRPVAAELFDLDEESRIGHIELADRAELVVLAPATADLIARLAAGLADELLTTLCLATRAPIVLCPSMNVNMWEHSATRENVAKLAARGAIVVGPGVGDMACGWVGAGRLVEPAEIVAACARALDDADITSPVEDRVAKPAAPPSVRSGADLAGLSLLVTAGPTHEPINPVRFLGNRSSGKMGFAIARRAAARGARVILVAGPVALPSPAGVTRVDVETAREMRDAVHDALEAAPPVDAAVFAAAVADFRPAAPATEKLKKDSAPSSLALEKNPDILAELGELKREQQAGPLLVGFAAETGTLAVEGPRKLAKKGCDLLVGNDVSEPGSGFGTDTNRVTFFEPDRAPRPLPLLDKDQVADEILDWISTHARRR